MSKSSKINRWNSYCVLYVTIYAIATSSDFIPVAKLTKPSNSAEILSAGHLFVFDVVGSLHRS